MGEGYCIEYEGTQRYPTIRKQKHDILQYVCITTVGIAFAVSLLFPQSRRKLQSVLIPGDDAVTVHAVKELTDRLRSGEKPKEALAAFCHIVIENGK